MQMYKEKEVKHSDEEGDEDSSSSDDENID